MAELTRDSDEDAAACIRDAPQAGGPVGKYRGGSDLEERGRGEPVRASGAGAGQFEEKQAQMQQKRESRNCDSQTNACRSTPNKLAISSISMLAPASGSAGASAPASSGGAQTPGPRVTAGGTRAGGPSVADLTTLSMSAHAGGAPNPLSTMRNSGSLERHVGHVQPVKLGRLPEDALQPEGHVLQSGSVARLRQRLLGRHAERR